MAHCSLGKTESLREAHGSAPCGFAPRGFTRRVVLRRVVSHRVRVVSHARRDGRSRSENPQSEARFVRYCIPFHRALPVFPAPHTQRYGAVPHRQQAGGPLLPQRRCAQGLVGRGELVGAAYHTVLYMVYIGGSCGRRIIPYYI